MIELNQIYIKNQIYINKTTSNDYFTMIFLIPICIDDLDQYTNLVIWFEKDSIYDIKIIRYITKTWFNDNCKKL